MASTGYAWCSGFSLEVFCVPVELGGIPHLALGSSAVFCWTTGGLVWGTLGADWGLWAWSCFWDAWSLLYLLIENLNLLCESPTITVRSEMFWGTRLSDLVKSPPDPEVDCEVEADCLSSVAWEVGGQGSSFAALLTMALQSRSTNLWNVEKTL